MAKFAFTDLHSFKDYVTYVQTYLPDQFPYREGAGPNEQWTLELVFKGLREGLGLAEIEKGERLEFKNCRNLVDEAYAAYCAGRMRDGFFKLEEVRTILKKIPTY